ncbi:probable histone-lysine N-methyltransferase PRDM7, partial [Tachysurus ichikawai]
VCMTSEVGTSDSKEFVVPIAVDQQKPIKKEELEDDLYGVSSSPVGRVDTADQQTGGFQRKPIKEEEPEDDEFFCLGVFNKGETIPLGAHFGPYEGDLVDKEEAMNSDYSWVVS